MELKNRVQEESYSMNEALLLATMCIIGLPVDVHVRDGSVYSGIFHTASFGKEYGIVLKKAKLTKKGRCATNVGNGSVIETLIIRAGDLVQVVAKEVPLSFDGFAGNIAHGNGEAAFEVLPSSDNPLNESKKFNKSTMDKRKSNRTRNSIQNENGFADGFVPARAGKEHEYRKLLQNPMENAKEVEYRKRDGTNIEQGEDASDATIAGREVGDERSPLLQDEYGQKFEIYVEESDKEVQHSVSSCESSALDTSKPVKSVEEGQAEPTTTLLGTGPSCDASVDGKNNNHCCEEPSATDIFQDAVCSSPVMDVSSESCQSSFATPTPVVPPQSSESNKNSKEFKLNPGAKVFSPSFATAASPMVPTVANVSLIPGNSHMIAVAGSQAEVGVGTFSPCSSASSKFVSYGNITAATGVSGSQFSQHIGGHMGGRTQPLRYAGQYHPVQAAAAYSNPHSQAGAAALCPVPARSLTPYHVQIPKHQGTAPGQAFQLGVTQPFVAGGQPPLSVPSHIQFLQPPFPVNRPIQVPESNGLFSAKLP